MRAASKPVLIVGAGPVGLSLAQLLTARGVEVHVFEAEHDLPRDMRASTFHPPTLDILANEGVADALVAQGHIADRWQYLRVDTGDTAVFDVGILADVTAYPFRLQCEQFRLTALLRERLVRNPLATLQFGSRLVGLEQSETDVTAAIESDGKVTNYSGAYIIGADGAKSAVRRLLGEDLKGSTYEKTNVTVVVDFPFEQHLPNMLFVNYVWTPDSHYSLMRVQGAWRTGFSPSAGQSAEEAAAHDNIQRHLQKILATGAPFRIVHGGAYTVHRRIVDSFRHGRVLLAGDAAHLNSPSGGMGMNSGIHDAYVLAEALAPVWHGGDDRALDLYAEARRHAALEDVQAQADINYRRHRETDPARREEIWGELKSITNDRARMRAYLLRSSLIESLARSGWKAPRTAA